MAHYLRSIVWVLLFSAVSAHADELTSLKERNARLEATVEELTLKLAESLKAQRQLEAALAQAKQDRTAVEAVVKTETLTASLPSNQSAAKPTTAQGQSSSHTANTTDVSYDSPNCKVSSVISGYRGTGEQNKAARAWLGSNDHLKRCSSEQLLILRKTIRWDFWGYSREAIAMIDRELEKR